DLNRELVGRNHVQEPSDLPVNRVAIGGVNGGALGRVVEEGVHRTHRRWYADLKGHALRDCTLGPEALVVLVRFLREPVIADGEPNALDTGLDAEIPAVALWRRLGVLARRRRRKRSRVGLARLVELRVARIHELRQEADPELTAPAGLTIRQRSHPRAQPLS